MITKYFTKVVVKFNPFTRDGKVARTFLCAIPPSMKSAGLVIDFEVLNHSSPKKPIIEVTFKDKNKLVIDPTTTNYKDVSTFFDRHSRTLQLQETIQS